MSKIKWRSEHTNVEKLGDELWLAAKNQSNTEIAGFLRNDFRISLGIKFCRGRALSGLGASPGYQIHSNSEYYRIYPGVRQWEKSFIVERGRAQTVS